MKTTLKNKIDKIIVNSLFKKGGTITQDEAEKLVYVIKPDKIKSGERGYSIHFIQGKRYYKIIHVKDSDNNICKGIFTDFGSGKKANFHFMWIFEDLQPCKGTSKYHKHFDEILTEYIKNKEMK